MKKLAAALLIILIFVIDLQAQEIVQKANEFLKTLSPELKSKTLFPMEDPERYNLNFIPIERKGTTFHDFDERQKNAALALLNASLSNEGYWKTTEIIELEKILFVLENNKNKFSDGNPWRDPLNYHFWIFGNPSPDNLWGWKFEGHHISLNFVSTENRIVSSTPSFMGTNPAVMEVQGHKRKEVLKKEADLGFQLVNSLTGDQLKIARFSDTAPEEIITRNHRNVEIIEPRGIYFAALNDHQKSIFKKLLNVYMENYEPGFSETLISKIEQAGLDNLSFAWAGSLKPGVAHYYRIQGPVILIEYDNTQNNANHVHSVVRDLTNDFGEDILKKHYRHDH
jgi:hypothetical protein